MAKIRVELDRVEVGKILKGEGITELLLDIGNDVANKAGDGYEAQVGSRKTRAVVNVIDPREGAFFREASTGNLARALGGTSR